MNDQNTTEQNTVFVRFNPPSKDLNRWHLENFFSRIGPIKKCSVISSTDKSGLGYGFVKFVSPEDARTATRKCDGANLDIDNKKFKLKVELASRPVTKEPNNQNIKTELTNEAGQSIGDDILARRKRTSRVIIRNLSFYAKEKDVKFAMEKEFGPVVEVTLPRVNDRLHRGFAFVTFLYSLDAQKATEVRETPIEIKRRPIAIDFAVAKAIHQRSRERTDDSEHKYDDGRRIKEENSDDENNGDDSINMRKKLSIDSSDSRQSDSDSDCSLSCESGSLSSNNKGLEIDNEENMEKKIFDDSGVTEKRTIFIRNLPFDVTRHDIFDLLRKFGYIESIYPVIDKKTNVFKGSAFCSFRTTESAANAVEAASGSELFSKKNIHSRSEGIQFRGRPLLVDYAVDKQTASTLTLDKRGAGKFTGKDRRCLYLSAEGYVAKQESGAPPLDSTVWESLPASDQLKRQRALADKTSKLKSPLFFINPKRLSIRNLAKHVDEAELKKLCVMATRRGLASDLVNEEDEVANMRATGDNSTREILKIIQEAKEKNQTIIPVFNEQNVKQFIPSVFIDRDFTANKKETGFSRGFGFVDFSHHSHALACLRELNNNVLYSSQYASGGKKALEAKNNLSKKKKKAHMTEYLSEDGRALLPRLIVDFTVENKIKAQQQITKRVKQQANREKQQASKEKAGNDAQAKSKKISRGARQRERKRKQREEDINSTSSGKKIEDAASENNASITKIPLTSKAKTTKTSKVKKQKSADSGDPCFEDLVKSYTSTFKTLSKPEALVDLEERRSHVVEKRWYE